MLSTLHPSDSSSACERMRSSASPAIVWASRRVSSRRTLQDLAPGLHLDDVRDPLRQFVRVLDT